MNRGLLALAFGTLALGITEFVMMGILSDVALNLGIDIATAGHLISAYALGVCFGAPVLILARKRPLKQILLGLVTLMIIGNLAATVAPNYETLLLARFFSGLPHGAYFGVGSIVAASLAKENQKSLAIAIMISGMTFANLIGVPLGTLASLHLSWRVVFFIVACWSLIVFLAIYKWLPNVPNLPDTGFKGQFVFLKSPAPWLLILATMVGNGSIFCWFSYVNPLFTNTAGFSAEAMSLLMVLAGLGMVIGNLLSGKLSDFFGPSKVALYVQGFVFILLLILFYFAEIPWIATPILFLSTAALFALSSPQQILLIQHSKGGELLGAASVQIAFNLGNALGSYLGGVSIGLGYEYSYTALFGVPLSLVGFLTLLIFRQYYVVKSSNNMQVH